MRKGCGSRQDARFRFECGTRLARTTANSCAWTAEARPGWTRLTDGCERKAAGKKRAWWQASCVRGCKPRAFRQTSERKLLGVEDKERKLLIEWHAAVRGPTPSVISNAHPRSSSVSARARLVISAQAREPLCSVSALPVLMRAVDLGKLYRQSGEARPKDWRNGEQRT